DPLRDYGLATLEGGDIMPVGNGSVLIGMGERTSPQAIGQLANALFERGTVNRVVACQMPSSRASMHLDTVSTVCGGNGVAAFREVTDQILGYDIRPGKGGKHISVSRDPRPMFDVVAEMPGCESLVVVPTGGDTPAEREREQ